MISYKDILFCVTKELSRSFDCDVFVESKGGVFENECFYVTVIPITSQASTRYTNSKSLMVSVKYFGGDKLENYNIADKLSVLFSRNLKVKDRHLNISNIEPNFLTDEVGDMLDFLIYVNYNDEIGEILPTYENMEDIDLVLKDERGD